MKFAADTKQAGAAMKDLQSQSDKLNKSYKDGTQAANNSIAAWGKAVAVGYTLTRMLEGATKVMKTFGNESLTMSEKWGHAVQDIAESIPLIGSLVKSGSALLKEIAWGDDARRFDKLNMGNARAQQEMATVDPLRGRHNDLIRGDAIAGFEARGGTMIDNFILNRAGRGAGFASDDMNNQGVRAALRAQEEARQRFGVAGKTLAFDRGNLREFGNAYDLAQQRVGETNNPRGLIQMAQHQGALDESARQRAAFEKQILTTRESAVNLARQEYELAKTTTGVQMQKLAILQKQADQAKSAATEFGMMSGADKLALKYGLQQAQQQGFDTLPEETRQLLARSGVTGEFAQGRARRGAADDPMYREIVGMLGGKTDELLAQELKDLGGKIEIQVEFDRRKLEEAMRESATEFFGEVQRLLMDGMHGERVRIDLRQQMQKAIENAAR